MCPATGISSGSRACSRQLAASGVERLPAERRYARRERSLRDGVVVTDRDWAMLQELLV
jgi:LDH2 family malate/lactate/ureidoglycolate dehydrogenase